jgi:hypothetical protein
VSISNKKNWLKRTLLLIMCVFILALLINSISDAQSYPPQTQSGGVGLGGKISSPPPTQGATITTPGNGAVFNDLPITVAGFCPKGLLVKVFKNNVFSGSVMCENSSYNIKIDLFSKQNDLVARVYDELDQAGPDSNIVTVTFNDDAARPDIVSRISITTNYARRGANPKELLTWPIVLSGGAPPYALSVDWGDGSSNDLYTVTSPGEFTIKHTFEQSGVFRALIKGTDRYNTTAYLQVVAIANGKIDPSSVAGASQDKNSVNTGKTVILWQPAAIAIPLIISTFWLGKKYQLARIKKRMQNGERPF